MRRLLVTTTMVLSLLFAGCGSDPVVTEIEERPTAVPAPTVGGQVIEIEPQEVEAETVLIGISADETVDIHALPGLDQPLAGEIPPGTNIEPMGAAFQTDDGLTWWQVQAGDIQGWVQPNIAYRGLATDITDQVLSTLSPASYPSAEEAASAVAEMIASTEGDPQIIVVDRNDGAERGTTYTTDLLGLQDDSVVGSRLIITMVVTDGVWAPASVVQFPLCSRGVNGQGLCL